MLVKRTKDAKKIALVQELGRVVAERQAAERREKELKELFRKHLGLRDAELHAGGLMLISKLQSRKYFDRDALKEQLGEDLSGYEKSTEYTELTVKTIFAELTVAGKREVRNEKRANEKR